MPPQIQVTGSKIACQRPLTPGLGGDAPITFVCSQWRWATLSHFASLGLSGKCSKANSPSSIAAPFTGTSSASLPWRRIASRSAR
jgi:hypothetical protein